MCSGFVTDHFRTVQHRFTVEIPLTIRQDPNFAGTVYQMIDRCGRYGASISTNFFYVRANRCPVPGNMVSGLCIVYPQRTRPSKLEMTKFRKNRNFAAVPPELRCSHGASSSFPGFVFTRTITYPKRVEIHQLLRHL